MPMQMLSEELRVELQVRKERHGDAEECKRTIDHGRKVSRQGFRNCLQAETEAVRGARGRDIRDGFHAREGVEQHRSKEHWRHWVIRDGRGREDDPFEENQQRIRKENP